MYFSTYQYLVKHLQFIQTLVLLVGSIALLTYEAIPKIPKAPVAAADFSVYRALEHVRNISKAPHYLSTKAHQEVQTYLWSQLENLGLQPELQEGYVYTKYKTMSRPVNIVARIQGREPGNAVLILSHYDSNPHSSLGASDAGSGVATILEGLRAFTESGNLPVNDIIICFTDNEELGLHGAKLFINQHRWAKDIGVILNFEARGSSGKSIMLVETNGKNKELITHFKKANVEQPFTNSLAYSVYKILPNDTDLTMFRIHGDKSGYNFAFIDNHFHYHTALDTYDNVNKNALQHQGNYLMALLSYFSSKPLPDLKGSEDVIYFSTPFTSLIVYPESWMIPLLGLIILLFLSVLYYGLHSKKIKISSVLISGLPFVIGLLLAAGAGFGIPQLLNLIYPGYREIVHDFPYNGHWYIYMAIALVISLLLYLYSTLQEHIEKAAYAVAPLVCWIFVCILIVLYLPGASYFEIPVLISIGLWWRQLRYPKGRGVGEVILSIPALAMIAPLIVLFPVALGIKAVVTTTVLTSLLFGLLISICTTFSREQSRNLASVLFVLAVGFGLQAHLESDFDESRPRPNSLVYLKNENTNQAIWASYDHQPDAWVLSHVDTSQREVSGESYDILANKYASAFTQIWKAPGHPIESAEIKIQLDTILEDKRKFYLSIQPKRNLNRIDMYIDHTEGIEQIQVQDFDIQIPKQKVLQSLLQREIQNRLITYYVSDTLPIDLKFTFKRNVNPASTLTVYESSFDLLEHPEFEVGPRPENTIPKPFVLNDAVIVRQEFPLALRNTDTTTTE